MHYILPRWKAYNLGLFFWFLVYKQVYENNRILEVVYYHIYNHWLYSQLSHACIHKHDVIRYNALQLQLLHLTTFTNKNTYTWSIGIFTGPLYSTYDSTSVLYILQPLNPSVQQTPIKPPWNTLFLSEEWNFAKTQWATFCLNGK